MFYKQFISDLIKKLQKDQLTNFSLYEEKEEQMYETDAIVYCQINNIDIEKFGRKSGEFIKYIDNAYYGKNFIDTLTNYVKISFKEFLVYISDSKKLKNLDLHSCELNDEHAVIIAEYIREHKLGNLEYINLAYNNFSITAIELIKQALRINFSLGFDIRTDQEQDNADIYLGPEDYPDNFPPLKELKNPKKSWKTRVSIDCECSCHILQK